MNEVPRLSGKDNEGMGEISLYVDRGMALSEGGYLFLTENYHQTMR